MHKRFGAVVAFVIAFVASILSTRQARACVMEVTVANDGSVQQLRDAEIALERGQLGYARELASDLVETGRDRDGRAVVIGALADARDPGATAEALATAERALRRRFDKTSSPVDRANWAEAAARTPEGRGDAYRELKELADKDLMGSSYAYAALGRLADARGEREVASTARARCETMAFDVAVCRPELRPVPLFDGEPESYAFAAAILIALELYRSGRARSARLARGLDARGRIAGAPWIGFGAPVQVAAFGAVGAYVVWRAHHPVETTLVCAVVAVLSLAVERGAFLFAAAHSKIDGYTMRPSSAAEAKRAARSIVLAFGPREPLVLESVGSTSFAVARVSRAPGLAVCGVAGLCALVSLILYVNLATPRTVTTNRASIRGITELPGG